MSGGDPHAMSFPRRYAATRRFTLGTPRSFAVAPDGQRVVFVRSRGGDDPVGCLWVLDVASGEERCVADPRELGVDEDNLPAEERARRERVRESAGGIVSYAVDRSASRAVFGLGARAYVADLESGDVAALPVEGPVVAPRLDPRGRYVAFGRDRALWICECDGTAERRLCFDESPNVVWGLADFVAAEEMGRTRGYWWGPDGRHLAVARVDESDVQQWHIADPVNPDVAPVAHRYPAAGTANADVSLHIVDLDGLSTPVQWDRAALEYLAAVSWREGEPLTVVAQSRDQQRLVVMSAAEDGSTTVVRDHTQQPWIDLVDGFPRWTADGELVHTLDEATTRRMAISGTPVTPLGLQIRRLIDVSPQRLVFTASRDDPTVVAVWTCTPSGDDLRAVSTLGGVADAAVGGETMVVVERSLAESGARTTAHTPDASRVITTHAEAPPIAVHATEVVLGERQLRGMLLLPSGHDTARGPLPVLLDPYGGPHAQRVVRSHDAHLQSQWFADAGFAVLVVDGRGSPGRGPQWEQEIVGDLGTAPLQDQVDALLACAEQHPDLLDLNRVAIKGWSFGGYLAALAVLRRPDVFHAAIAGAPVTDWTLYDTHYTERYLGHPQQAAQTYGASSLLDEAAGLTRPLLLIHGLTDDNVVAAHTLRFSRALLEARRPHVVLPLSGVTHMTPQEVVAENLLHLQLDFLRASLDL